jgi:hypothetical protein
VKLRVFAPTVTLFHPGLSGGGCVVSSVVVVTTKADAKGVDQTKQLMPHAQTTSARSQILRNIGWLDSHNARVVK